MGRDVGEVGMITCPKCSTIFEANEPRNSGNCHRCGKEYYRDEAAFEDKDGNWEDWSAIYWRAREEL